MLLKKGFVPSGSLTLIDMCSKDVLQEMNAFFAFFFFVVVLETELVSITEVHPSTLCLYFDTQ